MKKNSRQLAISKNKAALKETMFPADNALFYFNGTLNISRDLKGLPNLHLERLTKTLSGWPDTSLLDFFKNDDIKFTKINDTPWTGSNSETISTSRGNNIYFGLSDSIYVTTREAKIFLNDNKKNDVATVTLNGITVTDLLPLTKKNHQEDILLDTGMNILVLFADNFGDQLPNKGKMELRLGDKKTALDFNNKADSAAGFIVAKIYYGDAKENENSFKNYLSSIPEKYSVNDKLMGSIMATSQQIQLAIWDDAVEDGDSISIKINGQWYTKGFPVKKVPQFITITLKPGQNTINFIADNVGSIPPNTSVLEIIDGKKRKSYNLETLPGINNFVQIFYNAGNK